MRNTPALGVRRVLTEVEADAATVAEPTDMVIATAHRGFVWSEITVDGGAAHGSRPALGINAIIKTAKVLVELEELAAQLAVRPHDPLGPGTVHASVISGVQEASTIPGQCSVTIQRRTLPRDSLDDVEGEVAQLSRSRAESDPRFFAEASTLLHRPAMETAAGLSYWADSAFTAAGIPTVLCGPGGEGAHTDVEWVSISDTVDCARILAEAMIRIDNPSESPDREA